MIAIPSLRRSGALLAAVAAAALAACAGCQRSAAGAARAEPAAPGRPFALLESPSGRTSRVELEVARTLDERNRGLMFRDRLDPDAGMVFVFEGEDDHAFWMKNTFIPLDLIFVDGRGEVSGIVERAVPHSLTPVSGGPSRWVVEVNGGWCAAHGVRAGDRVKLVNVPPAAPEGGR